MYVDSIGKESHLLFLDSILHLNRARSRWFHTRSPPETFRRQGGHDKTRIAALVQVLGFGDHASRAAPGFLDRLIAKVLEDPGHLSGLDRSASAAFSSSPISFSSRGFFASPNT